MNDWWLIGVVGGSAGAALGLPIVVRHDRRPGDPWTPEAMLGVWLLMAGVGMILVGLRHGVVVTGAANRIAEHLSNVLNLLAWPVIVATARRAAHRPATWRDHHGIHFAPVVAYLAYALSNGGEGIRFIWILPVSLYNAARLGHLWFTVSRDSNIPAPTRSLIGGLVLVAFALAGAQTFRTFVRLVFTPLREIVPIVILGALFWIGGRVSGYVRISFQESPLSATASSSRYERSTLTAERAEELLRNLEACMRDGIYRHTDASLPMIARTLDVTPHMLSQAINQYTRQSLNEYLTKWRVSHARKELRDPANDCYTIEALATRSGFASRAAFYRAFRDAEEMTPTTFRSQTRQASHDT